MLMTDPPNTPAFTFTAKAGSSTTLANGAEFGPLDEYQAFKDVLLSENTNAISCNSRTLYCPKY